MMNRNVFYPLLIVLMMSSSVELRAQEIPDALQHWKDQKYSMFIHFGIYSVLGGVWDGKPVTRGLSEQIQAHAGIYSDTYAAVAKRFNPLRWNADSIALLAKSAGMRSIVITSKHHDGFCMFRTTTTDFNVVDATPFKRDIIQELSDACKKNGLKFGIYFSLIDWHFPQASPISSHNSDLITPEHHDYNKRQVTELLTNYGIISELWFDMGSQPIAQSKELRELVHHLQPNCMVSSRIGNDMGDFTVLGDNQEPDYRIGVPWQSPASFFDETWGYRSWQARGSEDDKMKEKLTSLIKVVSSGGNYLLNIGPKEDGSVVAFEKNVLLSIGKWLNKNAEAIYGTRPDPFDVAFDWGVVTCTANTLYLHVLKPPKESVIELPGFEGKIKNAYVLSSHRAVRVTRDKGGIQIELAGMLDPSEYQVIALEFENEYQILPTRVVRASSGKVILNKHNAFPFYSNSGIDYNTRVRSTIKELWTVSSTKEVTDGPHLYYTEEELGRVIDFQLDDKQLTFTLDGKEPVALKTEPNSIHWGPLYLAGPFWSGIEGANGNISNIDPDKPWPETHGNSWQAQVNWRNGEMLSLPADAMTAYYTLQEITSTKEQRILISAICGEGVVVFVNGEEEFVHLNPQGVNSSRHTLLINLKKGNNQVVIKFFNNFQKQLNFSIDRKPQQKIYHKQLLLNVELSKVKTISVSLHAPTTAHQSIDLPNLWIELRKK